MDILFAWAVAVQRLQGAQKAWDCMLWILFGSMKCWVKLIFKLNSERHPSSKFRKRYKILIVIGRGRNVWAHGKDSNAQKRSIMSCKTWVNSHANVNINFLIYLLFACLSHWVVSCRWGELLCNHHQDMNDGNRKQYPSRSLTLSLLDSFFFLHSLFSVLRLHAEGRLGAAAETCE